MATINCHYEITEGCNRDQPYLLVKDGECVDSGTWAYCHRKALSCASKGDAITSGRAAVRVLADKARKRYNRNAKACGLPHLLVNQGQEVTP